MIQKIKTYFSVFGFKQTVLKLFRYASERLHTDRSGVYTPARCEQSSITPKKRRVYIFSDRLYGEGGCAARYAEIFNSLGFAVSYYVIGKKPSPLKRPPLCLYKRFSSRLAKGMVFKDCVVVVDTVGELRSAFLVKARQEGCALIDTEKPIVGAEPVECAALLERLSGRSTFSEKYYGKISVVILNYNNRKVIFNCLDTLQKYNGKYGYEIIVVDNQSVDGSYEEIIDRYPDVKVYRNEKNGCSSGRNIGIDNAVGEYVLFLDSDQWILHGNWLDPYFEVIEAHPDWGAIGWTGGWFNRKGYAYHTVNNFPYNHMPPKVLCRKDVGYLGTGGMMVRKALLDEIGGFDLNYDPTCYEDTDMSLEIRHRGKELYYCPYLGVGHLPHQTTKSGSDAHEKLITEKGAYFTSKWKEKNPKLLKYVK